MGLTFVKTTGLIAVPPTEIAALVKASVSILYEAASKTSAVIAVIETVVKARRSLATTFRFSRICRASVFTR